jgi:hypothetical protein
MDIPAFIIHGRGDPSTQALKELSRLKKSSTDRADPKVPEKTEQQNNDIGCALASEYFF